MEKRSSEPGAPAEIRTAAAADRAQINGLLEQLYPGESPDFCPGAVRQGSRSFVTEIEGLVVGFALAAFVDYGVSGYGTIEELVVDLPHRGEGIGVKLLAACRAWLAEQHVQVIFVSALNEDAARFYVDRGFTRCTGPWLYCPTPPQPSDTQLPTGTETAV